MTPLQQLKQTPDTLFLSKSGKDIEYDHCPDFHFRFDVEIGRGVTYDGGTEFAPETWEANDSVEISELEVLFSEGMDEVDVGEDEKDEIRKELINRIQIQ